MTRGKPSSEQLNLSNGLLALPGEGDYLSQAKEDVRNYGNLQGLLEARALFSSMLGAPRRPHRRRQQCQPGHDERLYRLGASEGRARLSGALVADADTRVPLPRAWL